MSQEDIEGHNLSYIRYATTNSSDSVLSGIQLGFMNNHTSPFFETLYKEIVYSENERIERNEQIDMSSEVRSISMLIDSGIWYHGIRFYDDDHGFLLNS